MQSDSQLPGASPGSAPLGCYTAKDVFYNVRVKKSGHKWNNQIAGLLTNGGVVAMVLHGKETECLRWTEVVAV